MTIEEAMAASAKTESEEKPCSGTEEGTSPRMRVRTLQPPFEPANITLEQAIQAWAETEAEEKARRASKRKIARAASARNRQGGGKAVDGE